MNGDVPSVPLRNLVESGRQSTIIILLCHNLFKKPKTQPVIKLRKLSCYLKNKTVFLRHQTIFFHLYRCFNYK